MLKSKASRLRPEILLPEALKGICSVENMYNKAIAVALVVYEFKKADEVMASSFGELINGIQDEAIKTFILAEIDESYYGIIEQISVCNLEDIKNFLLYPEIMFAKNNAEIITPKSIIDIALKVLQISDGEKVMDVGSGIGSFNVEAYLKNPNAKYSGIELNSEAHAVSIIKNKILEADIAFIQGNVLKYENNMFDKIFSNYPLGMPAKRFSQINDYIEANKERCVALGKIGSSDWVFNHKIVDMLNDGGKAVAVMSMGGLFNTVDRDIRKHFINSSYIETIIELPPRMFANIGILTALVVFSKAEKSQITFVKATEEYVSGRWQNTLSEANIETILQATQGDTKISKVVDIATIAENEYNITPARYLDKPIEIHNGVAFSSVIKGITRGAPCSATELEAMLSKSITQNQYLMVANIKDGFIDEYELPYIKEIAKKHEKYCVKNNSLVISKNGMPFKVAVVSVEEGHKILANGNLYVIELDEAKVNPYFIKAFFDSEIGMRSLKSIAVGTAIPNIGVAQLNNLLIPMYPLEVQNRIAKKHLETMNEIAYLKKQINSAEAKLKTMFDFS